MYSQFMSWIWSEILLIIQQNEINSDAKMILINNNEFGFQLIAARFHNDVTNPFHNKRRIPFNNNDHQCCCSNCSHNQNFNRKGSPINQSNHTNGWSENFPWIIRNARATFAQTKDSQSYRTKAIKSLLIMWTRKLSTTKSLNDIKWNDYVHPMVGTYHSVICIYLYFSFTLITTTSISLIMFCSQDLFNIDWTQTSS